MSEQSATGIRAAETSDAKRIFEFLEPFVAERLILRRSQDEIEHLAKNAFCAWSGDEIVGFAAIEIYSRKLAEVLCLAVDSSQRKQGLGGRLIDCCIERARELDVMEVMAISSNEEFLQSCGFDYTLPDQKKALFYQLRDRE